MLTGCNRSFTAKLIACTTMLVGLLFAAAAHAQATPDTVVFGPKQYLRTSGAPNQYTDVFGVPANVGAPFLLRIVNGDANGCGRGDEDERKGRGELSRRTDDRGKHRPRKHSREDDRDDDRDDEAEEHCRRISSAWVTINGVQVAGPNDFHQNVAVVERTVTLSPNNTLEMKLASRPASFVTVTILGTRIPTTPSSLTPNPLTITAGATGTLTATLAPSPTAAGTLSLASANPAVAAVPASVPFAVGQTAVAAPVTALAEGNAVITATLNGGTAASTVQVLPHPPTVTSLTPASTTITQGAASTLTVTISAAQTANTAVNLSSSDTGVAFVPASVTVSAGQTSGSVQVSAVAPGTAQITAELNGSTAVAQVTVVPIPPTIVSLLPAANTVALGATTTLTLTISAAQPNATAVSLSSAPDGIVMVPATVTIPAGQVAVPVPVNALALGGATVRATLNNSTAEAVIQVLPPAPAVTALQPADLTLSVGATGSLTVKLNAAQLTPTQIPLSVDNHVALQVPASITVPAGQTAATFTVTGLALGDALVSASLNGAQSATVHVIPPAPVAVSLLPNPLPLQQGATGSLTLTINAAQLTDTLAPIGNSAPAIVQAPASITVPAGQTAVAFPVTGISPGAATLTATINGASVTATVQVTPPPPVVTSIAPVSLTLPKGTPGTLTVAVSRAPTDPTLVQLVTTDPLVAAVPATVTIAAGALTADIAVMSTGQGSATVTASLNGGAATAQVIVTPAELVTLTLSPQTPTAYVAEIVPFTLTGTFTDGATQDLTTQATWSSSNPNVASISTTGFASALTAGATTIAAASGAVTTSTVMTVRMPPALTLTPASATLKVDDSLVMTVASALAAGPEGLTVSITTSGAGSLTAPATVVIPAAQSTATFTVTGAIAGSVAVTVSAAQRLPATAQLTVTPKLSITGFTPAAGPVGSPVTITGTNFDPNPAANTVRFNGEPAVIATASATQLKVIVPIKAASGPITVTNALGTAVSPTPFMVNPQQDFDLTVAPDPVQIPRAGYGSVRVKLVSQGLNPYRNGVALSVSGLPPGVTYKTDPANLSINTDVIVTFTGDGTPAPGAYALTLTGAGASDTTTVTRTKGFTLQVLDATATTVTGRVLHAEDDSPFVNARIRLGGVAVYTDETGTYRFVNPQVIGDQVVLIDGNTNSTATTEYPSAIAMPVMIVAGQDNRVLTSYIQAVDTSKFTNITPGAQASVTNPDIPNFSLNIPSGAVLYGWDGTPVTKVNVRTVPVDRLPIRPLPDGVDTSTVYLYYFFREGGANPTQPIPVTMANDIGALPGAQIELWYYDESATPDPNSNQWRVMGTGTVSADGKSIVSDPGVGIPKFCCGATFPRRNSGGASTGGNGGNGSGKKGKGGKGKGGKGKGGKKGGGTWPANPGPGGSPGTGSNPSPAPNPAPNPPAAPTPSPGPAQPQSPCPVDLASGNNLAFWMRDFGIKSLLPVNLDCQYRSTDPRVGAFGRGVSFAYDWFAEQAADAVRVTTPEGVRYLLSKEADGVYRMREGRSGALGWEVRTTASGRTLRFPQGDEHDFDAAGRLVAIRDTSGNTIRFQLNANGFIQSVTDGAGQAYRFDNTTVQVGRTIYTLVTKITDSLGRSQSFAYDTQARLISHTDAGGGVTTYEYDAANRISKRTDPRGGAIQFQYDAAGRATKEILEDGVSSMTYSYVAAGATVAETRVTDPNGNLTTYRFNGQGFVTRVADALGRTTAYSRDFARNQLLSETDPLGRVTRYTYDDRGNTTSIKDALGNLTVFDYDPLLNKTTKITDALGQVTRYEYDPKGNLIRAINAENEATSFTYTPQGELATVSNPLGHTTTFSYDGQGNLSLAIDALGNAITYTYDAANRLSSTTDAREATTLLAYDNVDRITQVTDAIGGITRYAYDGSDNLLSVTDPRGNAIETNVYDLRNRLITKTDAKLKNTVFGYDANGNVTQVTDRKGQVTTLGYDALSRVTQINSADGRTMQYFYDLPGNVSRISDSQSGDILFQYDDLNRVVQVSTGQGTIGYQYDAIGRRTQRTVNGADPTDYAYDKANRVKTITFRGKTVTYSYDLAGRLTVKTLPNGITQNFAYDDANRLTQIQFQKADGTVLETIAYNYDQAGNRISKALSAGSIQETPFSATYDEANRMLTYNGSALTYDDNGNLISRDGPSGPTTYTWDAQNRLVGISGSNGTASFKYDAMGRRIEKTVNGQTTGFLYDGAQAIAELQGNAISTAYHTGLAIDEVLARYAGSGNKTLLTDALQSVIAQADDTGQIQNYYAYTPYGEVLTLGPDDGNPIQYTGRENDGTGLIYDRARYLDQQLKQFNSEDPAGIAAGLNVRAYVGGNPVNRIDPLGLQQLIISGNYDPNSTNQTCYSAPEGRTYCYDPNTGVTSVYQPGSFLGNVARSATGWATATANFLQSTCPAIFPPLQPANGVCGTSGCSSARRD